jgi:chemotaxis response regulator CheB
MPDQAAMDAAPRVVLLARAGKAADNLAEALRQAGAELLFAGDPAVTDEASLRAHRPQAVLVALEPSIEPALDKLEGLLSDPDLTVIFDEADLAAHRAGWDAARWVRHLSAKLRRDSNVLPPGTENDQDWQPSPGAIPKPAAAHVDADLADFAREAVAHADRVPVDGTPSEAPRALHAAAAVPMDAALIAAIPSVSATAVPPQPQPSAVPPPLPPAGFELEALEAELLGMTTPAMPQAQAPMSSDSVSFDDLAIEEISLESAPIERARSESMQLDSMQLDSMQLDSMQLEPIAFDNEDSVSLDAMSLDSAVLDSAGFDATTFERGSLESVQLDGMPLDGMQLAPAALDDAPSEAPSDLAPMRFDDDAFFLEELSVTRVSADASSVGPIAFDDGFDGGLSLDAFDIEEPTPPAQKPRVVEEVISFEDLIAGSATAAQDVPVSSVAIVEPPRPVSAEPSLGFSLGDLSLTPVDDAPAPVAAPARSPASAPDLSALEARISGLSLVDIDEGAADPSSPFGASLACGVVLVEAGLGGPDPVRQLLAALPAEFPAVVLVRLHLQGGRYDRLVAQMERASSLPVALAEAGANANPGTIYFLPEGVGLAARGVGFGFVADPAPAAGIFAALPPKNSALVFLSGSDPQLVDVAQATAAAGTLVIAQSAEDCYDGTACAELRARGVVSALPVELAGRLASRWPSSRSD